MAKMLEVEFPAKCIGCELCIAAAQRQLKKIGLDESPIRIFRSKENNAMMGKLVFRIHIDESINTLDVEKIKKSCPTGVFKVVEKDI